MKPAKWYQKLYYQAFILSVSKTFLLFAGSYLYHSVDRNKEVSLNDQLVYVSWDPIATDMIYHTAHNYGAAFARYDLPRYDSHKRTLAKTISGNGDI